MANPWLTLPGTDIIKDSFQKIEQAFDALYNKLSLAAPTELTISSGAITVTQSSHVVDTEGSASTDDLTTINGGNQTDILILRPVSNGRVITLKHGTGNIVTFDGTDVVLTSATAAVFLIRATSSWIVIGIQGVKRTGDTSTGQQTVQISGSITDIANLQLRTRNTDISTASRRSGLVMEVVDSLGNAIKNAIFAGKETADTGRIEVFVDNAKVLNLAEGGHATPGSDNTQNFGSASLRWKEIFAGTGTINTSDENEKEQIADLSTAEHNVAVAIKGLIKKFKFKDAVALKGSAARIHFGVIAQDIADAFAAEGLDAHDYGLFCEDTWWERVETFTPMVDNPDYDSEQPDGPENPKQIEGEPYTETVIYNEPVDGGTERTRLGIRYDELLAFVVAGL